MTNRSFRLLACGVAALALACVGTGVAAPAALAQGKTSATALHVAKKKKKQSLQKALGINFRTFVLKVSAKYMGISVQTLRNQLPGHSLAQVASSNGKTTAGLKTAVISVFAAKVHAAKAKGKMTSREASRLLTRFKKHVQQVLNRKYPAK